MPNSNETWPEAIATVLECRYEMRAGRALAFGLPSDKHYRITYNYFADGTHHTGVFYSAKAIPQNTLFPVRYDPDIPREHLHAWSSVTPDGPRRTLLALGIFGSLLLVIAWFVILRGCR